MTYRKDADIFRMMAETTKSMKMFQQTQDFIHKDFPFLIKNLAVYGWYISGDISLIDLAHLKPVLVSKNTQKLDEFMIDFYQKEIDRMVDVLIKRYPGREALLKEARDCYHEKKYHASTILLISQADGICLGKLFLGAGGKAKMRDHLADLDTNKYMTGILSVLTDPSTIDKPTSKHKKGELTRHSIMHGINTEYGNKKNNLQALSLLSFIVDFMEKYRDE